MQRKQQAQVTKKQHGQKIDEKQKNKRPRRQKTFQVSDLTKRGAFHERNKLRLKGKSRAQLMHSCLVAVSRLVGTTWRSSLFAITVAGNSEEVIY
jgi:hypothetical protein